MERSVTGSTLVRIGLTGGIGAGKSTVAEIWREEGVRVIDLDAHSRAVLDRPGEGLEEAIARFGEQYRSDAGTADREALARLVFSDAAARADLERIVLSRVDAAIADEEAAAVAAGERMVVHDSPLLLEKGHDDGRYRCVVAVIAPREQRLRRIEEGRGRPRSYTESVMGAQVGDLERIRRADRLIMNGQGLEALRARSLTLLAALRAELGAAASPPPARPAAPTAAVRETAAGQSR
ncbi:dephospho-CoA kinase [Brachybacterium phenoliresistens]|uniref:Dephospho-CoA kinase n=1 Tax=Brachybacterium phenoliresistens TaxID=396014 RepID=Z9JYD9_9MICO|nr:dephospho-CoA kinase [Brachybacterium phenoliresistens]EWS82812.1 dephospho-CoA kinase [Brachybacterium phenoliresistens]